MTISRLVYSGYGAPGSPFAYYATVSGSSPDQYLPVDLGYSLGGPLKAGDLFLVVTFSEPTSYGTPPGWTLVASELKFGTALWSHNLTSAEAASPPTVNFPTSVGAFAYMAYRGSAGFAQLSDVEIASSATSAATNLAAVTPTSGSWQAFFGALGGSTYDGGALAYNPTITPAPATTGTYSMMAAYGGFAAWFADTDGPITSGTAYTLNNSNNGYGYAVYSFLVSEGSPPNAPTLTTPANGAYIDATVSGNNQFTGTYNSTDGANANARALRIKSSGATSYSYLNVSSNTLQSTIVWNTVNIAPGGSGTFTVPGLVNGVTDNWSMADQESLANLQGPFASDFSVNFQVAPNLVINEPSGSIVTSSAPSLQYVPTPAQGASVIGGQWLVYPQSVTTQTGFSIDIATGTIPAGYVSNVTWTGNPLTVALQSGVALDNGTTYVAYAAIIETGNEYSSTISSAFTIALDSPATPGGAVYSNPGGAPVPPNNEIQIQGHDNLLSAVDASFETGLGVWGNGTNCTVSQSSAKALDGSHSLLMQFSVGSQQRAFESPVNECLPNTFYTAMAFFLAATTARDMVVIAEQFTADGAYIGAAGTSPSVTDNTTTWTQGIVQFTTASNAAYLRLQIGVANNDASAGEEHYADECGIFPGYVTDWTRGGLAGSMFATLLRSDNVYVRNASPNVPVALPAPSQSATVYDYEITPQVQYYYTIQTSLTLSPGSVITSPPALASAPILTTTSWYHFDPLNPTTTAVVANPTTWTPVNTEQSTAHMVTGQQVLNIVADTMLHQDFAGTFELFDTPTYAAFEALLKSQATIFISSPWGVTDTGYFRVGPQSGGMSTGMGNKTKNTTLLPSTASNGHRTVQVTAVAQNRPVV